MALGFVIQQSSVSSSTDATSYTCATSYTPPASSLLIAFICVDGDAGDDPDSVTGHGLTYTKICNELQWASANGSMFVYAALAGGSPTSTPVTVSDSHTYIGGWCQETYVTGAYVSGTVSQAFLQTTLTTTGSTGTSGSITLAAASNSANRPMSFWMHNTNQTKTPQTNWTEGGDIGHGSPTRGGEWQYRDDAFDTAAAASWATNSAYGGIAFEVVEASAGAPPSTTDTVGMIPL